MSETFGHTPAPSAPSAPKLASTLLTEGPRRFVPLTLELLAGAALEDAFGVHDVATGESAVSGLYAASECGWALIGGGHVLAAGGLVANADGRGEAFFISSQNANARDLTAAIDHFGCVLDAAQQRPRFREIDIAIRENTSWRELLVNAIGFSPKGVIEINDGGPVTYRLYSRVIGHA